jgi:hypothetical protein
MIALCGYEVKNPTFAYIETGSDGRVIKAA